MRHCFKFLGGSDEKTKSVLSWSLHSSMGNQIKPHKETYKLKKMILFQVGTNAKREQTRVIA